MDKIFISYSSKDQKLADAVCNYLERRKLNCFVAARDITPGMDYLESLMNELDGCKKVVVLFTKEANESPWVRNEIERAFHLKKPIILFRVENIALSKSLQVLFATFHWLEAFDYTPSVYFDKLYCSIKDLALPPIPRRVVFPQKIAVAFLAVFFVASMAFLLWDRNAIKNYLYFAHKDSYGIPLSENIRHASLTAIDYLSGNHSAPPEQVFRKAQKEVLVVGRTNNRTFEITGFVIDSLMRRGIKVKMICLHPASTDTAIFRPINNSSFESEFRKTKKFISQRKASFPDSIFSVRMADKLPPFTGIMIDGDVSNISYPDDNQGIVRITPVLLADLKTRAKDDKISYDWVLQFTNNNSNSAFTSYSNEFRNMWAHAVEYK